MIAERCAILMVSREFSAIQNTNKAEERWSRNV
jgi:hypothetical protein